MINKWLYKIRKGIRSLFSPQTLEQHYRKALESRRRTEEKMDYYIKNTPDGACCPGCVFGSEFTDLSAYWDRQTEWINVMKKKLDISKVS